jgi:nicotinate-nucleotide--dimethylbenzimidazole phosphoribosyltransferase
VTVQADFDETERAAVYRVIASRRDVREFSPGGIEDDVLERILAAAHRAPSVGFSQPWGFVIVRDRSKRERVRASFIACRDAEASRFQGERRQRYLSYKLEGILESAVNIAVVVDLRAAEEAILGATAQPEAIRWSACCAVQNLWLAARAEGIGIGWVSIVEPAVLREALDLPPGVEPVAYLCVGRPLQFRDRPMLEETGWRPRIPLADVLHEERYRDRASRPGLLSADQAAPPGDGGLPAIAPLDEVVAGAARELQRRLTKPVGSLGRLEEIAIWYASCRGSFPVSAPARAEIYIFAGDHGVVTEGVSAYPSSVTAGMVRNMLAGGSAANALAHAAGVAVTVVDVGVAAVLDGLPVRGPATFRDERVRAGTRNLRREAAMTRAEAEAALDVGVRCARDAATRGCDLLAGGEVGIGNSTAAAALVAALTGLEASEVTGHGTGIDSETLLRKTEVVGDALRLHRPSPSDPLGCLAALGGFEIAALAGFFIGAAAHRVPVVVDGFIASAAALAACALRPALHPWLVLAHRSAELGAVIAADRLALAPLLDLGMRLGEGTGALLAIPIIRGAVEAQATMATFSTAGIIRSESSATGRGAELVRDV